MENVPVLAIDLSTGRLDAAQAIRATATLQMDSKEQAAKLKALAIAAP